MSKEQEIIAAKHPCGKCKQEMQIVVTEDNPHLTGGKIHRASAFPR